jgi:hypothetical protein
MFSFAQLRLFRKTISLIYPNTRCRFDGPPATRRMPRLVLHRTGGSYFSYPRDRPSSFKLRQSYGALTPQSIIEVARGEVAFESDFKFLFHNGVLKVSSPSYLGDEQVLRICLQSSSKSYIWYLETPEFIICRRSYGGAP